MDKALQKQRTRDRVQRYRDRQKALQSDSVTPEGVTYPAIVEALVNPVKRKKLEAISQSLKDHNVAREVRYGVCGPTFDVIEELLGLT